MVHTNYSLKTSKYMVQDNRTTHSQSKPQRRRPHSLSSITREPLPEDVDLEEVEELSSADEDSEVHRINVVAVALSRESEVEEVDSKVDTTTGEAAITVVEDVSVTGTTSHSEIAMPLFKLSQIGVYWKRLISLAS